MPTTDVYNDLCLMSDISSAWLIPHREQSVSIINKIQCSIVSSASAHILHRTQAVTSIKAVQPQPISYTEHKLLQV
jgi:hypothetical protein